MTIDPIGDMLTRIRNSLLNRAETVIIPASKVKEAILKVLKQNGYIADFKVTDKKDTHPVIEVTLRYENDKPAIRQLDRVSRPGLRVYSQSKRLPRVVSGLGMTIVSTPQGIMSGREARRKGVGGEIICRVW